MVGDGLGIVGNDRDTRLKWHRLRRSLADPEFGADVMRAGFALGASMELDLNVRGDGGFVVLHDATLDRETTGRGKVADMTGAALGLITYVQSGQPLILSETLAGMITRAHPNALLQFDMKDDLAAVGRRGVDHLVDLFGQTAGQIIFSGGATALIRALAERLPQVPRGIDPTDRLVERIAAEGVAAAEAALTAELRDGTQPDTCYLAWELVLGAQDQGCDLVALCHAEGVKVDAWTFTLAAPDTGFSDAEWLAFGKLMALAPDQITTDEAVATEAAWHARTVVM
ncbi:MAG: glycerophosphodiester phosphodiesterase family protein [Alphaproteobacteria bacterium]|jgi:glycerophosphoryl diester phosphodiesterase